MESTRTDVELLTAACANDQIAFNELISRYSQKVHNLAMRITRNEEDTEEILQDVFVTVYKKGSYFEGKSAFSSWLYRITVNTAFMKLRKRKQSPAVSLEEVNAHVKDAWVSTRADDCDSNVISTRHELREQLELAVSALPEEYRAIFILRDIDGLSNQEVGEILHLSVAAVKSRLHRSRLMLRKRLQRYHRDYFCEHSISYGATAQLALAA